MCGIAGWFSPAGGADLGPVAQGMADTIAHRGPDDQGVWTDAAAGLALAHRRLSILDLSPSGSQPMLSACGRCVVVFNGEIYNHLELRRQLGEAPGAGPAWRGHSDTETLVECVAAWGVERALKAFVGMFAFALWDRRERTLTLARDRMGEKPLYYSWQGGTFLFASELKALRAHPGFSAEIDRDAIADLLRQNYVPAPRSIFKGVHKLRPAHMLVLPLGAGPASARSAVPVPYWKLSEVIADGLDNPIRGNVVEAVDMVEAQLRETIRDQMLSDVPVGALLSGGIDSSIIVALMQAESPTPVRTFTIGFREAEFDEAAHARDVAHHFGTRHTETILDARDALELIPELPTTYCEPFADSSQLPTMLVSRVARREVTVALTGDGGDELFLGYPSYFAAMRLWKVVGRAPLPLRRRLAGLLAAVPAAAWDLAFSALRPAMPPRWAAKLRGDRPKRLAQYLGARDRTDLFLLMRSLWKHPGTVVLGADDADERRARANELPDIAAFEPLMMALDCQGFLPEDILVKVDRAAMAAGLETRVPLLDHRLVELAWRLPTDLKMRGGQQKWILRQLLKRHVPQALTERPKMGFSIPLEHWLRGPLRGWAEDMLSPDRLRREGFFAPETVQQIWSSHLSGKQALQYHVWPILMFQAWLSAGQVTNRVGV